MEKIGLAETVIEKKVGCGPFQILIVIFLFLLVKITSAITFIFMAFGNYNPGYRCLDNDTNYRSFTNNSQSSWSDTSVNSSLEYSKDFICEEFEACRFVEFNPDSSTIVTEWGLVCERSWISALIISIQMAGNLVGSFFSGQAVDNFGRKKTLYGSILINILLTSCSALSNSWEMFAVFRFFIGFVSAFFESLSYIYPAEFLSRRWRGPLMGVPGWAIGGITFGVISMLLKNWKYVLFASSAVFTISFLPIVWVPESLRWLEVKNKTKDFNCTAEKMAKFNGATLETYKTRGYVPKQEPPRKEQQKVDKAKYTITDLFRRGYWRVSLIIAPSWTFLSMVYYCLSFGVKSLSGNFYINLILLYAIFIPFTIIPLFATNVLGRKGASCVFVFLSGICYFAAMVSELSASGNVRLVSVLILFILGMISLDTSWTSQQVHLTELYPTVIRGKAINWANAMARIGGIIAPFLIPKDTENIYVWYLIMGCLAVVSCCLFTRLPETKGKPLKETFEKARETVTEIKVKEGDEENGMLMS